MYGVIALLIVALPTLQDEVENIRHLLAEQVAAWNRGDIEGYMEGYWKSDSTVFVSGGSVLRGYGEVLQRYRKQYDTREKMGRLTFDDLAIRMLSSSVAIATGTWKLQREHDEPWGRFTLILELKQEGWRIVYDHTSLHTS